MSIDAIAEVLQRTYEDFQSGRLNEAEAGVMGGATSHRCDAKLDELKLAMERPEDAQSS